MTTDLTKRRGAGSAFPSQPQCTMGVGVGLHKSDTTKKTTVFKALLTYETTCTHALTHQNRRFEKGGGGGVRGVGREVR